MSTAIFQRVGKDAFKKLRLYRDFGGASVKNDFVGPVSSTRPIHHAVQSAITHVEFLESDNLSGIPLNTKYSNETRDSDPYLAQHLRDLSKVYFENHK
jgi:hypothetical protein